MNWVLTWWILLSLIATANIGFWIFSWASLARRTEALAPNIVETRRRLTLLSGFYVLLCAYRSYFPRVDLERVCLVDSWWSNVFLGRSAASIAELCFIVQCTLLLVEAGRGTNIKLVGLVARVLVPMIVVAESVSWYAALTTNYLGSVVEESLWAVAGILLLASFFMLWPHFADRQRKFLAAVMLYALGFVAFMVTVDVPMYWSRWQLNTAADSIYFALTEGVGDALATCHVDFSLDVWREEIPWMSLYFSVSVWYSLAMAYAPPFDQPLPKAAEFGRPGSNLS